VLAIFGKMNSRHRPIPAVHRIHMKPTGKWESCLSISPEAVAHRQCQKLGSSRPNGDTRFLGCPAPEQRNPTFGASQEFLSSSPDRSFPLLVQFGHSSVPDAREQSSDGWLAVPRGGGAFLVCNGYSMAVCLLPAPGNRCACLEHAATSPVQP
jgi:hypothetical protein